MSVLLVPATGMNAQDQIVRTISNNIANANTPGYRYEFAILQDIGYKNDKPGAISTDQNTLASGTVKGLGVKVSGTGRLETMGELKETGRMLDLAINGRGYFIIHTPYGIRYTKAGNFMLSGDGHIVTMDGYGVDPNIQLPKNYTNLRIDQMGQIFAKDLTNSESLIGTLKLADFNNPAGLNPVGGNLYEETSISGGMYNISPGLDYGGKIMSGYIEMSNVNIVSALVELIAAQRAYQMNAKVMSTINEMYQSGINI